MDFSLDTEHPRIGVGVIILRGRKVLLGLRKGHRSPGCYGLPGGYLEKNENFEDCARREVFEETGFAGMSLQPIYLISGSSDNIHYTDIIFYANYKDGEPTVRETDRVENWEWFDVFDLPSPLYGPTKLALNRFVSNFLFHKLNLFLQHWFPPKRVTIQYVDSMNTEKYQSK